MRKKTQWITFHDDTDEKAVVRNMLLRFGFFALQDEVLFFNKVSGHLVSVTQEYFSEQEILKRFYVHYPDLFCPNIKPQIVCEIDGDVHWQNSKAVKRTNARNCHYGTAGLRFLWLTTNEVLKSSESKLLEIISHKLSL